MCEIENKNVRCCIDKNELILGNLMWFEWYWKSRNKNVPIIVLVVVNLRFTQSTKVYVEREGENAGVEEVEYRWGGDSRVT